MAGGVGRKGWQALGWLVFTQGAAWPGRGSVLGKGHGDISCLVAASAPCSSVAPAGCLQPAEVSPSPRSKWAPRLVAQGHHLLEALC